MKILHSDEIEKRFSDLGAEPVGSTQSQFAAFINSETAESAKVITESGSKVG